MGRELINPPDLHPTPGFSHIALATGERFAFVAGQVALDREFNIVGEGDLRAQTVAAMRNLSQALTAIGAAWDDVVRRTIYTTMPHEFETLGDGIAEVTGGAPDPPQTIVGVTGLALPGLLVEIEATVSLP